MPHNEHDCGCGHHHEEGHAHEHHHHHHDHAHGEACGCGCEHTEIPTVEGLTPMQVDFLLALAQRQCLPVACFSLAGSHNDDLYAIALAPVYMSAGTDEMEHVKAVGAELASLEAAGLVTLDYDIRLKGYAYAEYVNSDLYTYFAKTVQEAAMLPDAAFDTPVLELGSMALTDAGADMVEMILA